MKVIAFFLPQYHEIEENNKWWGKGFTEWTNVKKAKPLFKNHYQPIEPKDDYYYDLMDKETVKWQTKIAEEHSVYGFAYYHYYFKGRKLLEKPAENLLKWKEINQRFCFVWANHDWKRSWQGTSELLLKQEYGNESDWIEHFNYLKQFFVDERYIKVDGKPMFTVYDPSSIKDFDKMIKLWNELCIQSGFKGIYIAEVYRKKYSELKTSKETSAVILSEPGFAFNNLNFSYKAFAKIKNELQRMSNREHLKSYSYRHIVKTSLKNFRKVETNKKVFYGAFTAWDNSSRHESRGYIIDGSTPDKFKEYLKRIKELAEQKDSEFMFINAWNEWCEGMYLEPDKKFGYGYLEAVKEVIENNN